MFVAVSFSIVPYVYGLYPCVFSACVIPPVGRPAGWYAKFIQEESSENIPESSLRIVLPNLPSLSKAGLSSAMSQ